ncbi:MAG: hypothetical protein NVSMB70_01710 [Chamaesiphon sp.]
MIYALIPVAFVAHVFLTFLFYSAIMAMMLARDMGRLTKAVELLAYPVVYAGMFLDLTLSIFWGTLVFLDLPREGLLTIRLIRYKRQGTGWRFKFASWICSQMLDPLAPSGCHCKT